MSFSASSSIYVVTKEARLRVASQQSAGLTTRDTKAHTVAIEGQVIFDKAVGNVLGHFFVWHDMLGQVLGCERGAIDGGVNGIRNAGGRRKGELVQTLDYWSMNLAVTTDRGKMDHFRVWLQSFSGRRKVKDVGEGGGRARWALALPKALRPYLLAVGLILEQVTTHKTDYRRGDG